MKEKTQGVNDMPRAAQVISVKKGNWTFFYGTGDWTTSHFWLRFPTLVAFTITSQFSSHSVQVSLLEGLKRSVCSELVYRVDDFRGGHTDQTSQVKALRIRLNVSRGTEKTTLSASDYHDLLICFQVFWSLLHLLSVRPHWRALCQHHQEATDTKRWPLGGDWEGSWPGRGQAIHPPICLQPGISDPGIPGLSTAAHPSAVYKHPAAEHHYWKMYVYIFIFACIWGSNGEENKVYFVSGEIHSYVHSILSLCSSY